MKKNVWIALAVIVLTIIVYVGYTLLTTKSHSPFKETTINFQGTDVTVAYCQPYKKGRLIFGEESEGALQPFGKYWRLGANEATTITFSADVNFAGKNVAAGTYVMYTVPGKDAFEVSLNSEVGRWGAAEANHDLDIVKVSAATSASNPEVEQFTINLNEDTSGVLMTFEWDRTVVSVPITK
jgi:DUF2911 family protein